MPTPTPEDFLTGDNKRKRVLSRNIGENWNIRELPNTDLVATWKPTGANFIIVGGASGPSGGEWESFVPTKVNVTVGNGVEKARFTRIGRTIHFHYSLLFGSTTAFTGTVVINAPIATTALASGSDAAGAALLIQSGSVHSVGTAFFNNTVALRVQPPGVTVQVNSTTPFTWGTSDVFGFVVTYEAAS